MRAWPTRIGRTASASSFDLRMPLPRRRERSAALLRAARIARRFAPGEFESILARAYSADPADTAAAACTRACWSRRSERTSFSRRNGSYSRAFRTRRSDARVAFEFGSRWAQRHHNPNVAAQFLEEALRLNPSASPRSRTCASATAPVGGLGASSRTGRRAAGSLAAAASVAYLLASAGLVAWRQQGDLLKAPPVFQAI